MALTVKDILLLPSTSGFEQVAGKDGLSRSVTSAGILDWELTPGKNDYAGEFGPVFDPDSLIISSLLFIKDSPEELAAVIMKLAGYGIAALAYKDVFFKELPKEALDCADSIGFPVFRFSNDIWFENIIFEVMDAVRSDDAVYLAEDRISAMIKGDITGRELNRILRGVSLLIKKNAATAYLKDPLLDTGRVYNSFYVNKGLRDKVLLARYDGGLFVLMTSDLSGEEAFRHIFQSVSETLPIPREARPSFSHVHRSQNMDRAFRESYHTYLASLISGLGFASFTDIGLFRFLIPLADDPDLAEYSEGIVRALGESADTASCYIKNGGDINAASIDLGCHANTVRYRIANMKKAVGMPDSTDHEFFRDVSIALAVHGIRQNRKASD
ncbi:MAG: PucR family transcriptional regulator [Clostridia bacterium]|nr:PucR family transcriptional regulator [Clostridia bacterium]